MEPPTSEELLARATRLREEAGRHEPEHKLPLLKLKSSGSRLSGTIPTCGCGHAYMEHFGPWRPKALIPVSGPCKKCPKGSCNAWHAKPALVESQTLYEGNSSAKLRSVAALDHAVLPEPEPQQDSVVVIAESPPLPPVPSPISPPEPLPQAPIEPVAEPMEPEQEAEPMARTPADKQAQALIDEAEGTAPAKRASPRYTVRKCCGSKGPRHLKTCPVAYPEQALVGKKVKVSGPKNKRKVEVVEDDEERPQPLPATFGDALFPKGAKAAKKAKKPRAKPVITRKAKAKVERLAASVSPETKEHMLGKTGLVSVHIPITLGDAGNEPSLKVVVFGKGDFAINIEERDLFDLKEHDLDAIIEACVTAKRIGGSS